MFEDRLAELRGGVCLQHLLVRSWNRTGNRSLMPKKTSFFPPWFILWNNCWGSPTPFQAYFLIMNQRTDSSSEYRSRCPAPSDLYMHIWLRLCQCTWVCTFACSCKRWDDKGLRQWNSNLWSCRIDGVWRSHFVIYFLTGISACWKVKENFQSCDRPLQSTNISFYSVV